MSERPYATLLVAAMCVTVIVGLALHVIERTSLHNLTVYDSMWVTAVTQSTGYGDIVPQTNLGRIVAIGPGFLGVFTLSLVVVHSAKDLTLRRREKKLAEALSNAVYARRQLSALACVYIQRRWRLQVARRLQSPNRLSKLVLLVEARKQFREKSWKALKRTPDLEDEILFFSEDIGKLFAFGKNRLRALKVHEKMVDTLSTRQFGITARVLAFRQSVLRLLTPPDPSQPLRVVGRRRTAYCRRSSILQKRVTDLAVRKLIVRMHSRTERPSAQFSQSSITERRDIRRTSNVF